MLCGAYSSICQLNIFVENEELAFLLIHKIFTMKLNYLFLMVLLLCLFTNCSNSNEDGSSSSDAILPLGVGIAGHTSTHLLTVMGLSIAQILPD